MVAQPYTEMRRCRGPATTRTLAGVVGSQGAIPGRPAPHRSRAAAVWRGVAAGLTGLAHMAPGVHAASPAAGSTTGTADFPAGGPRKPALPVRGFHQGTRGSNGTSTRCRIDGRNASLYRVALSRWQREADHRWELQVSHHPQLPGLPVGCRMTNNSRPGLSAAQILTAARRRRPESRLCSKGNHPGIRPCRCRRWPWLPRRPRLRRANPGRRASASDSAPV